MAVTPTPPVVVVPSEPSVSETTIQSWIRGNGTFRPTINLYGLVDQMTDAHWQSFLSIPYLNGGNVTLDVHAPTTSLAAGMTSYVDTGPFTDPAPSGAWTLVYNPNNTADVRIGFPDPASLVTGRAADNTYLTGGTGSTFRIQQGRMALLMHRGLNNYYLHMF